VKDTILLNNKSSEYDGPFKEHLLAQYLKYIEMADKISERRVLTNSFFITLNTGIISALGVFNLFSKTISAYTIVIISIVLCTLCIYWIQSIKSYSQLNKVKFNIICEIEIYLPMRPYGYEWDRLDKGATKSIYQPSGKIEKNIPYLFLALYILISGFYLYSKIFV
jgi:hypothetical protein